jgi:hypothetical protein
MDKSVHLDIFVLAVRTAWMDGWMISFTLTPRYTSDIVRTAVCTFRVTTNTLFSFI